MTLIKQEFQKHIKKINNNDFIYKHKIAFYLLSEMQLKLYEEGFRAVTTSEMKHAMQYLKEKGAVELRPTYDCDYKLCGRGWFSCA